MKANISYFKNSNTGELIMKHDFSETSIDIEDVYYDIFNKQIIKPNMTGFVLIKAKKFYKAANKFHLPR